MKRLTYWLLVLLLLVPLSMGFRAVNSDEDLSNWMYLSDLPENVYPVQEYKAALPGEKPAFLYDPQYPLPRIVEFYAHWCGHCRHFKPHYVELARKLKEITDRLPSDIDVEVRAVSCVPNKDICHDMQVKGYPSVNLFKAFSVNGTYINHGNIHPSKVLSALGIDVDKYDTSEGLARLAQDGVAEESTNGNLKKSNNVSKQQVQRQHFKDRSKKEIFDDAHLSLDFLLRNGVYTSSGPLSSAQKGALVGLLEVASIVLPLSSSLHPVVLALLTNRMAIGKSEENLIETLDILDRPPSSTWSSACIQHGTGYTCGLWTLFHILTVGAVEWNRLAVDPLQRLAPTEVADVLRNVIEHFFQCEVCRANFLSEYDACGHDRCNRLVADKETSSLRDWKQLPLWLYETHNSVNIRLRQERLDNHEDEDTTSPWQVQWPPVYDCPGCWLSQGRWDEDQVYRFLRLQYWPEDYNSPELRSHLQSLREDLHPDVALAIHKHHVIHEDSNLDVPVSSMPLMSLALLSIVSAYAWHRKRWITARDNSSK